MANSKVEMTEADLKKRYPLAHVDGIITVHLLLFVSGSMCPECGYATRKTSKKWGACKKCGRTKIPQMTMKEAGKRIKEAFKKDTERGE